ncbi:MAG: trypsin-like peptidase domain-containing protein, partial [Deltaproteobacteria bacterium]|nr:trypsin-like peptidase domain-containing protein [Deltaproteobacteria bacterium]
MKKGLQCFAAIFLIFWGINAYSKTTAQVLNNVSPGLVKIQADNTKNNIRSKGSGVVVGTDLVATNYHVIKEADEIHVIYNGKQYEARVQHKDWDRDVCTLNVSGLNARAVAKGNTGSLKAGARVYAINARENPQESPLAEGVILGMRSVNNGKFLQISAPVLPGSSGGGLFDEEGRLIGIMSYYSDIEGRKSYYALPVEWIYELPGRRQGMPDTSEIRSNVFLKKSVELEEKKDWAELSENALCWTKAYPREYAAWFSLGNAYAKSEQYDKAIESLKQALKINCNYSETWFILGIMYKKAG